ncbi:hypothetical protein [Clostridium perfringens]|uniref:Uncharacterized protein n=1 Tax=Clostridium perfringens E str. JGS1987 TaxID=451755 RepID=B1BNJ3_CLOPF|nr:hypothetical protein [Clostridium perfringens]EDT16699.1 conserved hypothetical protein [Clostridium perfringens E str. JGS1987]EJT6558971.1 hypothetical protein [Clostridium perfringens]EJT6560081.1 hypothetical protein [Clostridium perfringens]ELC8459849.1 hypothetical protein [Clostridium perfringens]ELC8460938.1 hypothetical protein [Clostridium perfringens]
MRRWENPEVIALGVKNTEFVDGIASGNDNGNGLNPNCFCREELNDNHDCGAKPNKCGCCALKVKS